jgi:RNA polymerase sigma-70 factor (ECF subfamily)
MRNKLDLKNIETRFANIVEENKDKIYRICCYYLSDDDEVKDLYQEVLMNIWKGLDKFREDSLITTWIFRITVNSALAFLARQKKSKKVALFEDVIINSQQESQKDRNKEIKQLQKAVSQLPLLDMIIISLVLEEVSTKEIANITGLTGGNVRVRIHRAKEVLRKIIEGEKS